MFLQGGKSREITLGKPYHISILYRYPPWQPTPLNLQIQLAEANKEDSAKCHNKLIQELFGKPHDNDIFYTDGSQMGNSIGAAVIHGANSQKWNLGSKVDNYDAEIWAIQKALEWAIEEKSYCRL